MLNLGCINHEEISFLRLPVENQVVNDAASLVQHQGILPLPIFEPPDIVGQDPVEPLRDTFSGDQKLPHVRNVKNAEFIANSSMFGDDSVVMDWHLPASKWEKSGA